MDSKELLQVPIARLVGRWPLLGAIVASWEIVSDPVPTMAIGMGRAGLRLYVNPQFVVGITLDETVAVLLHEVRHVIYGHIYQSPSAFADPAALTIAQEVTVNENLPGPLPGKPIVLSDFPRLPPDEDTLTRYRRLEVVIPPTGDAGADSDVDADDHQALEHDDVIAGAAEAKAHGGHQVGAGTTAKSPETLDSHDRWCEIDHHESLIRQQIEATARRVRAAAMARQVTLDPTEVTILESMLNRGSAPGRHWSGIDGGGRAQVDWRRELRHWVGRLGEITPTYQHPPRRYPHLLGIVPGKRRLPKRPRLLVAVDTSGSISDAQLEDFCAELTKLARGREMWIAEVDSEIQRLYRYRGPISHVVGRGGTSFRPIFEPTVLHRVRPDLVVYLTDGAGDVPDHPPRVPVLWVLTPGGQKPSPWGQEIRLM